MNTDANPPAPNQQVLDITSSSPPAVVADPVFGTLVAVMGDQHRIIIASDQSDPPFKPEVVNPGWSTVDTPALALALEWGRVYLAWVDERGAILLANSGDGWDKAILVAPAGSSSFGPALAFDGNTVYIAWTGRDFYLLTATCDTGDNVEFCPTGKQAYSRPTLTWSNGYLYAACGGNTDVGEVPMSFYLSTDKGQSFNDLPAETNFSIGPPSLTVVNSQYYLVWADGTDSTLRFAMTADLSSYTATAYSDGCHDGGPAIVGLDGLLVGWTYGAPPEDPRSHHVTLAKLPLSTPAPEVDKERYVRELRTRAPDPCPDSLSVWNPAQGKCVPKGGCLGGCVLKSMSSVYKVGPVFNPVMYAYCVVKCEKD